MSLSTPAPDGARPRLSRLARFATGPNARALRSAVEDIQTWLLADSSAEKHLWLKDGALFEKTPKGRGKPFTADKKIRAAVFLPRSEGLARTISLPAAAKRDLHAIVRHQINRLTPFQTDAVVFDMDEIATEGDALSARLTVLPKETAAAAVKAAETQNIICTRLALSGQEDDAINLLPAGLKAKRQGGIRKRLFQVATVLGALYIALGVFAAGGALMHENMRIAALKEETRSAALAPNGGARQAALFLAAQQQKRIAAADIMEALSVAVPDTAYLETVKAGAGAITVTGRAENAAAVLAAVDASPVATNARFSGAIAKDADTGLERFTLTAQLTGAAP